MLGKIVDTVNVNPWYVMADSLKLKEVKWKSPKYMFGLYKATAKLKEYNSHEVTEKSIYFWVLPWQIIIAIVTVSLLILLLLSFVFRNFRITRLDRNKVKKIKNKK